ncbi:host specificity protein J, partial [Leclercia adecarboxylata]
MANATAIRGRKGGGSSSRTPTEQPDDLQSVAKAKILIALGEGEFSGQLTGKNIYLDGTPLENADGSQNFSGVAWEFRSGTQAQQYIQGIPGTENEITVGTEVSSATAWTRTFTNTQLSAVRLRLKWPSLFKQENDGDLVGYSINYAIDLQTDGGTWQTVLNTSVTGKTTSGYERSHRIDLPQEGSSWTIRLRKITADANSAKIGDTMTLQSFTEVIDAKLRYPNTALLYIEFDSSQFNGSIPQISCEPRGRVIRVPDTYNPETRTYTGTWTGSFKWAWTDNPAWIFYDLVVSDRFGLGHRLTAANIDKWMLYQVAQYCDQPVPDGKGGSGTEPRYICNVYIQDRNDAYTVLRDFAAIFRGMTYWGGDQIVALADMPRDVDYSYTRANVIEGRFTYASSTTKTRYTTALVSWSDPANAYADAMEPVFEQALVARYGFNQLEMTAIGCTRQSEANRKGRWGILTNNKDRIVSFDVGLDGNIPQPGYIIAVADEMLSGKVTGGRISAVNGRVITLDRAPDATAGNRLILNLPSGASQSRTIQAVNGKAVTVSTAYSETPQAESVWVVESDELYAQQYRVISVKDNNDGTFSIAGAWHDPDKYARIDTGAIIDQRPVSMIPPGNQFAPGNIVISSYSMVNQGISIETMRASWDPAPNAIAYEAQWRRNDGNWVNVPRSSTTSFEVAAIYAGHYLVRVRAINAAEISSSWATSLEVTLTGKTGAPPVPVNFRTTPLLWGVQLDWDFPANTADTLQTEIQYSTDAAGTNAMLLTDVPYPQHMYQQLGLKAGVGFWYRARLIDRTGNQSAWTDFIQGSSSSVAADYLVDIDNQIKQTDAYKELTADIADLSDDIQSARDDISKVTTESAATKAGLAQEVTDRKKAITDEATARAQALLTEKNERVADISNVNQTIQTTTESLAQQIGQISAGTGSQFDPAKIWYFDSTVEGWTGNGTPTIVDGWIRPANHATDPWVASPGSLGVNSSSYRFVKLRIRKFGAPGWAGQLRWRGTGGFNNTNMVTVAEPAYDANGIATLEFDNIPWLTEATMNQFRLDLSTKQDATNYYLIDWVALGRPTPGAGMAALQQETTARVAGDQAESTARETLATQIRGGYTGDDPSKLASGLLYTERQARITAQEAEVTARTALESTVNANKASVTQELATLTTEQEAQATTLSGLQTTVGKNTGDITRIDKAVADNNKAQTTALAAVKATTDKNTADISTETTARTDGDSALGRRIDSLKVDVDGNTASRDAGIVGNVTNALANFMAFSDQR